MGVEIYLNRICTSHYKAYNKSAEQWGWLKHDSQSETLKKEIQQIMMPKFWSALSVHRLQILFVRGSLQVSMKVLINHLVSVQNYVELKTQN